ncbi:MAG TPA: ABC transporter substrate-binding protein [Stellaceae bacterium]|nr:ABC transporter substrate-binding protein [Stellaceae bacterium]
MALLIALPVHAEPVSFGDLGIVGDAPFYIAQEKGYFAAAKIEVAPVRFDSAAQAPVQLATNQLQVMVGGLGAALFNTFARDLPVRIVMGNTRDMPGFSSDTLLVREDLRDRVRTLADLKGRKIAINAPAGALDYMIGKMLAAAGLRPRDADIVFVPWPDQGAAFANRAIEGGAVSEPFATLYAERHLAFAFKHAADVLTDPPLQVSVVLFSKAWMDAKPEEARAFAMAYLRGARDYCDAMRGGTMRAEVIDILARHTSLKDQALYRRIQWSYMDPNGEIVLTSLADQQAWFAAEGAVATPVDVDRMVDRRFLDQALAALGRVETK